MQDIPTEEYAQVPIKESNHICGPGYAEWVTGYMMFQKWLVPCGEIYPLPHGGPARSELDHWTGESMDVDGKSYSAYQPMKEVWRAIPTLSRKDVEP